MIKDIKKSENYLALFRKKSFFLFIFVVIVLVLLAVFYRPASPKQESSLKLVLWAWERPENLLFLKEKNVGVAFLAGSVVFQNGEIQKTPRLQPLKVNETTPLIAVVRIDNLNNEGIKLTDDGISELADFIVEICSQGNRIRSCQIDFDATASERDFYKELIFQVRDNLPETMSLSITSLVSWCNRDSWLADLSIDDAVPMFYRLGADDSLIRNNLANTSFMKSEICQKSVGVSLDEPLPDAEYLKNRQIYIFNPRSWTEDDFNSIIRAIEKKLINEIN